MKIKFILLITVFSTLRLLAQQSIGVGIATSHKSPLGNASLIVDYDIKNITNIYGSFVYSRFEGIGCSFGVNMLLLKKSIFQPLIGLEYNFQNGMKSTFGHYNQGHSEYMTSNLHRYSCSIGVRIKLAEPEKKDFLTIAPYLFYRFHTSNDKAIFIGGIQNNNIEKRINNKLSTGFGIGVKFTWYFKSWKKIS